MSWFRTLVRSSSFALRNHATSSSSSSSASHSSVSTAAAGAMSSSSAAAGRTTRSQSRSPVKATAAEARDERPKRELIGSSPAATTPSPSKRARKASGSSSAASPAGAPGRRTPSASPSKQNLALPSLSQTSTTANSSAAQDESLLPPLVDEQDVHLYTTVPHPTLPFSLPDAISHLTHIDSRFHKIVSQVPAKPFQELVPSSTTDESVVKELNLHKTLTTSIVGQQISWLAARSVLYKFVRLFFPHDLPLTPDFDATPREGLPFPTPHQILLKTDVELRSAGLSGQKVKYVRDVSRRFADGRLDARRLVEMQEEQVIEELVQIKGVGVWTAEMTLLFALRRPNVLPVGDLGIQRGILLFYLSEPPEVDEQGRFTDQGGVNISPRKKVPAASPRKKAVAAKEEEEEDLPIPPSQTSRQLLDEAKEAEKVFEGAAELGGGGSGVASASSHPLGPVLDPRDQHHLPTPGRQATTTTVQPIPPESGLTAAILRSRRDGKKVKGAYLTPEEMHSLAKVWEPYRSLASFYMYTLIDGVPGS